jgi:hypothetical protein
MHRTSQLQTGLRAAISPVAAPKGNADAVAEFG